MPHGKITVNIKIYTQHNFPILQYYRSAFPYQPTHEKITFNFLFQFSEFFFLFSDDPRGLLIFCLPADEATAKSVTKNFPTDSEKQTAVVCNDNGVFSLTKPLLCQKPTTLVKTPPVSASLASFATVRVLCVCVCVCISSKDMLITQTLALYSCLT